PSSSCPSSEGAITASAATNRGTAMSNERPKSDLLQILRAVGAFLLAGALVLIPAGIVLWEVRERGNALENGPIESVQLALLLCASAAYAIRARAARGGRGPSRAFALCSLFVLSMCIRELDGFFDRLTGDHQFWFYIVALVVLAAMCILFRRFSRSVHDLAQFSAGPETPLFAAGVLVCVVFAQIIGHKGVWSDVFGLPIWQTAVEQNLSDGKLPAALDIQRHVKNIVEESTEICGYLLILFSAILPPAFGCRFPPDPQQHGAQRIGDSGNKKN
ncbi:MAG: hypothetical protein IJP66_04615, partial [Kiritimatiellae bacterium]|nr:hypothetical protein [Kiritimatiellia bacterium]